MANKIDATIQIINMGHSIPLLYKGLNHKINPTSKPIEMAIKAPTNVTNLVLETFLGG